MYISNLKSEWRQLAAKRYEEYYGYGFDNKSPINSFPWSSTKEGRYFWSLLDSWSRRIISRNYNTEKKYKLSELPTNAVIYIEDESKFSEAEKILSGFKLVGRGVPEFRNLNWKKDSIYLLEELTFKQYEIHYKDGVVAVLENLPTDWSDVEKVVEIT